MDMSSKTANKCNQLNRLESADARAHLIRVKCVRDERRKKKKENVFNSDKEL